MSAALASLVPLPVVIDAPGPYFTRSGERVEITEASSRQNFGCWGTYPNGLRGYWHKSGRRYAGSASTNDIVSKAPAAAVPPPPLRLDLAADEAEELRECLSAYTLDLSTAAIDDEDRPRVNRLHAVLQRLEAALRGA